MAQKVNAHQFFHPWHAIEVGKQAPEIVNAIIEIPQGSKTKYELDKQTGFLRLDRILSTHLRYPVHYGFVPQTYCLDHDPLDILVICAEPLIPLTIVEARVLGGLTMVDGGEQDDKIIAVVHTDPAMKQKNSLGDINPEILETISYFFANYKKAENKVVEIGGFIQKNDALRVVQESIELYKKTWQ